jgi:hypothetical protein
MEQMGFFETSVNNYQYMLRLSQKSADLKEEFVIS